MVFCCVEDYELYEMENENDDVGIGNDDCKQRNDITNVTRAL